MYDVQFFMSSNAKNLDEFLRAAEAEGALTVTIEAEYGDTVVEGNVYTAAHHGPRAGNPAPCNDHGLAMCLMNTPRDSKIYVGLSHRDLDTVLGAWQLIGNTLPILSLGKVAEFVDTTGPHHFSKALFEAEERHRAWIDDTIHGYWSWSQKNQLFAPRDGSVLDVTDQMYAALNILDCLLLTGFEDRREALVADGKDLKARTAELDKAASSTELAKSWSQHRVRLLEADAFVNHLYADGSGSVHEGVVGYNPERGTVTVSLADPIDGVSCREIVQELWGPGAGGHDGIAGGPRDKHLAPDEALRAAKALLDALPDFSNS